MEKRKLRSQARRLGSLPFGGLPFCVGGCGVSIFPNCFLSFDINSIT